MSATRFSFVNGDALRGLCDHVFWSNSSPRADMRFRHGQVVFCKVDEAWRLLGAARRRCARIAIVTGEGDLPVDDRLWDHRPPQVVRWLGTNMFVGLPEAEAIPLGLGNAGAKKTLAWQDIEAAHERPVGRADWLYANFSAHSNPELRGPLLDWLARPAQQWVTRAGSDKGKESYLRNLQCHRYVLCPPGNGEDTHRFWEALYCGAIPIIRESPAMASFAGLGALVVEDLQSITKGMLEAHFIQHAGINRAMLELSYWSERVDAARRLAASSPRLSWSGWIAALWKELLVIHTRPSC